MRGPRFITLMYPYSNLIFHPPEAFPFNEQHITAMAPHASTLMATDMGNADECLIPTAIKPHAGKRKKS